MYSMCDRMNVFWEHSTHVTCFSHTCLEKFTKGPLDCHPHPLVPWDRSQYS